MSPVLTHSWELRNVEGREATGQLEQGTTSRLRLLQPPEKIIDDDFGLVVTSSGIVEFDNDQTVILEQPGAVMVLDRGRTGVKRFAHHFQEAPFAVRAYQEIRLLLILFSSSSQDCSRIGKEQHVPTFQRLLDVDLRAGAEAEAVMIEGRSADERSGIERQGIDHGRFR